MFDLQPVAVGTAEDNFQIMVSSHQLGCELQKFEHVYETSIDTLDEPQKDGTWYPLKHTPPTEEAETSGVRRRELRSKSSADRGKTHTDALNVDSGASGEESGEDRDGDHSDEGAGSEGEWPPSTIKRKPRQFLPSQDSDADEPSGSALQGDDEEGFDNVSGSDAASGEDEDDAPENTATDLEASAPGNDMDVENEHHFSPPRDAPAQTVEHCTPVPLTPCSPPWQAGGDHESPQPLSPVVESRNLNEGMALLGECAGLLSPEPSPSRVRILSPPAREEITCDAQPPVVNCPLVTVEQEKSPVHAATGVDSDVVSEGSIPAHELYNDLEIRHDESAPPADIEDELGSHSGAAGDRAEVNSNPQFVVLHRVGGHEAGMAPAQINETPVSEAEDMLGFTPSLAPVVNCPVATTEEVSVPQKSFPTTDDRTVDGDKLPVDVDSLHSSMVSEGEDDARVAPTENPNSSTAGESEDALGFTPSLVPVVNCPLATTEEASVPQESFPATDERTVDTDKLPVAVDSIHCSMVSEAEDDARVAPMEIPNSSTAAESEDLLGFTPSPVPVVNCPLVTIENDEGLVLAQHLEGLVLAAVPGPTSEASAVPPPEVPPIPALRTVKEEVTVSLPSNKDNPIEIDSGSDDDAYRESLLDFPSEGESDLSDGPNDVVPADGGEQKVSAQRALRLQLQKISKKKLAVNREALRASRELATQNKVLRMELERVREEARQRELKLEEAIRMSQVVSASEFTDSPSTHITHQTTSIASAREVSDHEAEVSEGPVDNIIPATQVYRFPSLIQKFCWMFYVIFTKVMRC